MAPLPKETTEVHREVSQRERNEGGREQPGREIMVIESTSDVIGGKKRRCVSVCVCGGGAAG